MILLVSIPVLYWIGYGLATIFHEPYQGGNGGMDFYKLTLLYLSGFLIITLPVIVTVHDLLIKNQIFSTVIHLAWFIFIVWFTLGDLFYRPYEHGLLLACVGSTSITRIVLDKMVKKLFYQ